MSNRVLGMLAEPPEKSKRRMVQIHDAIQSRCGDQMFYDALHAWNSIQPGECEQCFSMSRYPLHLPFDIDAMVSIREFSKKLVAASLLSDRKDARDMVVSPPNWNMLLGTSRFGKAMKPARAELFAFLHRYGATSRTIKSGFKDIFNGMSDQRQLSFLEELEGLALYVDRKVIEAILTGIK